LSPEEEDKKTAAAAKKPAAAAKKPAAAAKKPAAAAKKPAAAAKKPAAAKAAATRTRATAAADVPARDAPAEEAPVAEEVAAAAKAPAASKAPAKREKRKVEVGPLPRLMARYRGEIKGQLFKDFDYTSIMQVPEVTKVIINIGLGEALTNGKALETAPEQIGMITGQKAVITKARRSIAQFKVREGQPIGVMVTMRGRRMYEFLDRMISMALPRIRDFRGVSRTAFDGNGNYALGLREQIMFPEIDYGSIDRIRGMQITITTSARTDPEGFRLLELMGLPFAREDQTR
jgi:large subunit ribosomal protein L5